MLRQRVPLAAAFRALPQGISTRLILFALATLALLIFGDSLAEAATAVGTIAGSFAATPTGGAAYSMPLPAPGGAGGLSPSLSLDYASGSGPGLLGWDMTVGGLSVIKRCPSSYAYDDGAAPVNLTIRDRFCLDGQELSLTSGTYGDNGAVYVTTPTAHMEVFAESTNGSSWFKVRHPDGSTWYYGYQHNSSVNATNAAGQAVTRLWALYRIEDAYSNTVDFYYTQPSGTGAYYLSEVDWGANVNQGTSADHSLVFSYATVGADATRYRYLVGNEITWNRRLSKITLKYNSTTTLTWTPSYLADGTDSDRSRLSSIKECAASGNCMPTTTFQWQQGSTGYASAYDSGKSGPTSGTAFVADVNGDGREDLVYDCGGNWCVRFGLAGGGFGSSAHSTYVAVVNAGYAQPIHYEPGAGDELLVENGSGHWAIVAWDSGSSSFTTTDTGITATSDGVVAADVNGDGYDDLVAPNAGGGELLVYLNTTLTSSGPGFGTPETAYSLPEAGRTTNSFVGFRGIGTSASRGPRRVLHFARTGAGLVARIYHTQTICYVDGCPPGSRQRTFKNWHDQAFVWTGSGFSLYGSTFSASTTGVAGGDVFPLDVNGDGLTDLMLSGSATLLLNTGTTLSSVTYGSSTSGLELDQAVALDYSGNGRDDVLVPDAATGDWMRLPSQGTTLGAPVDTGVASGDFGSQPVVADTEGRMLDDLVGVNSSGDIEWSMRNGWAVPSTSYPDLVTNITDGFGNYHSLTWAPLSDATVAPDTGGSGKQYELARRGPYLLASVQANDGVGSSYTLSYVYDTPRISAGVGFWGVGSTVATDSRTDYVTTTLWGQNLFKIGLPTQVTIQHSNDPIEEQKYQRQLFQAGPEVLQSWQTYRYDSTGTLLTHITRFYTYDDDAEPQDVKVTTTNTTNGKTWVNDTTFAPAEATANGNWCFGLVSTSTVTDTLPTGANASRETDYGTDPVHCRVTSVTTNAGAATPFQTTSTLGYDGFGNVATDKVVGHKPDGSAMAARTTAYSYQAPAGAAYNNGEFQTQVTDAAGDVTQAAWNGALGVQTAQTAANGAVTTYAYDGFGRRTRTTLPSGGYETVTYKAWSCADCGYLTVAVRHTSGGVASGGTNHYYDGLGRLRITSVSRSDAPSYAYSTISYNALGQIIGRTVPYYGGDTVYWTHYHYDALGRVTSIDAPASTTAMAPTSVTYNGFATTVNGPGGYTETVTRNPLGQVTQVTDAAGNASTYTYAPFAELTQITGADGATTALTYDPAGHRTKLVGSDRGTLNFSVDSLGEVTQEINARNQAINIYYDSLGRMTQRSFPKPDSSSTETQQWHYATSGNGTGQLSSESDNVTGFTRTVGNYNSLGEPTSIEETYAGIPQTLTLGYDSLGRISSVTYPVSVDGHALTVNYHYDGSGNLDKVSNVADGTVYWQPQTNAGFPAMNALGQMQAYVLGGGLDVERLHDAATGAVTSITSGPNGSGNVLNLATDYNASGSRLTLNDLNAGLYESYSYDHFQRLMGVTRTATAGNSSSSFSYHAAGQFNQGPAGSYSYGSFPAHSPSSTTENGTTTNYTYNQDGDRTAARLPQVTWDALGKAHTITPQPGENPIDLTYGPDGGLVDTTSAEGGRYFGAWLKWQDSSDWSARILVQGRAIAVVKDSSGSVNTRYLLRGPLGSTQAVATGAGSLTQRIAYGAWGSFVHPDTGTGTPNVTAIAKATTVTYTGHELIAGTGLINMGARLYDPATGLFMSPDPTVAHPFDTQDLNQYAYVEDNPMTFTDPYGLFQCPQGVMCVYGSYIPCPPGTVGDHEPNCSAGSIDLSLFAEGGGFGPRGGGGGGFGGPSRPVLKLSIKASSNCLSAIANSNVLAGAQVQAPGPDSVMIFGLGPGGSSVLEARFGGSLPSRLNNLGDEQHSSSGAPYQLSAIGTFTDVINGQAHILNIYPSIAVGTQALSERLAAAGNESLSQELTTYGGSNAPPNYASNIASSAGVSSSDAFNNLSPSQQAAVVQALINNEGAMPADVSCATTGGH